MISELLLNEIKELQTDGYVIEYEEKNDGLIYLKFFHYSLPPIYKKSETTLLLKIPISYPNGNPDMFWTETALEFKDGSYPKEGISQENINETNWTRFSWHLKKWNPGKDSLKTYIEFVNYRLNQKK